MKLMLLFALILIQQLYGIDGEFSANKITDQEAGRSKNLNVKVVTYNLGMLSTDLAYVPLFKDREVLINRELGRFLVSEKPSVLFLQEIWHGSSMAEIQKAAAYANYFTVIQDNMKKHNSMLFDNYHGLQILVSRDLLARSENLKYGFKSLKQAESYICGYGLFCRRGYAFIRLTIDNHKYVFATFHLTPLITEIAKRKSEIMEIIRQLENENADYIIIGADFNYSPDFGALKKEDIFKGETRIWKKNGKLYSEWVDLWDNAGYTCKDNWIDAKSGIPGYTQNRESNFIASMGDSTKKEPSQRIDQIWTCSKIPNSLDIGNVNLVFTGKINGMNNRRYELSDHYGVASEISIKSVMRIYSNAALCRTNDKTCFVQNAKQ